MAKEKTNAGKIFEAIEFIRSGTPLDQVAKHFGRSKSTLEKWNSIYSKASNVDDVRLILDQDNTRYVQIMRALFDEKWYRGSNGFEWHREDLNRIASSLGIQIPKNLGDNIYSIRHGRENLPDSIKNLAPKGRSWLLLPNGKSGYKFYLAKSAFIDIERKVPVDIPDSTPSIVARYAQQDEQAVLARIRYCRLVDIFLGLASFHLQSHFRTSMRHFGGAQTELDELYVGIDSNGTQYAIPIQAKSENERIGAVQVISDHYVCREKFSAMKSKTLAAKTVCIEQGTDGSSLFTIALVEVAVSGYDVHKVNEVHFRLVPTTMIL